MPDSAQQQDATADAVAGTRAGDQEGGRVNAMKTLGKRTSERDDAIAERDRLRAELAALGQSTPR